MTKSSADDSCQLVRRSGKRKRRGTRRFGLLSASKFGKIPRLLLIFFFCIFPGCKWAAWGGGVYDSVVVGHPAVRGATATPCQTRRRMSVHRMERAQGDASVTSGWR